MNITLASQEVLRGDMVVRAVLRSDLAPIPLTLEATVKTSESIGAQIKEGEKVSAGRDGCEFRIVKVVQAKEVQGVQGKELYGALSFTALFESCHKVAFRAKSAIIKEGATLGGIYGACGAAVSIQSDFTVNKFACFVGGIPSFHIAKALQEEGGTIVLDGKRLKFIRLPDIFKQDPAARIAADTAEDVVSGFLERHEVPFFYSLKPDGDFIFGNRDKVRAAQYIPRTDARVLRNMTRALVTRKILRAEFMPTINAGQVIEMNKKKYGVITAAHAHESGTDGEGVNQYSKFWLGTLEE